MGRCGNAGVSGDDVVEGTFDTMRTLVVGNRMSFPFPTAGFPLLGIGGFRVSGGRAQRGVGVSVALRLLGRLLVCSSAPRISPEFEE
jgi:hypothetical protein